MSDQPNVVVVTGGLGGVGRWVVDRFANDGFEVICIDHRTPRESVENVRFFAADLTNASEALELLDAVDPDAVVHLAAIPDPTEHAGTRVFENNVLTAYNVLFAAGRLGARISWASSESAYGFPFSPSLLLPDYLPIDETHPMRPEDPYGVSKVVGESVAEMVARRFGVQIASIRPSWVQYPGTCQTRDVRESVDIDRIDPGTAIAGSGNFWSYIDVRDVADMFVRSVQTGFDGHKPFLCHADENYMGVETGRLFEALCDGAPPQPCKLTGEESAFTTAKATEELGWEPKHSWRDSESASLDGPSFAR